MKESNERMARKIEAMIRFANDLASLATCEDVKTGCVIFPVDCSKVDAIGYNGSPVGTSNGWKLPGTSSGQGKTGMAHAEMNAIAKCSPDLWTMPRILYTTVSPCTRCASAIANVEKITFVIYTKEYEHDRDGLSVLASCGVWCVPWFHPYIDCTVTAIKQARDANRPGLQWRRNALRMLKMQMILQSS